MKLALIGVLMIIVLLSLIKKISLCNYFLCGSISLILPALLFISLFKNTIDVKSILSFKQTYYEICTFTFLIYFYIALIRKAIKLSKINKNNQNINVKRYGVNLIICGCFTVCSILIALLHYHAYFRLLQTIILVLFVPLAFIFWNYISSVIFLSIILLFFHIFSIVMIVYGISILKESSRHKSSLGNQQIVWEYDSVNTDYTNEKSK